MVPKEIAVAGDLGPDDIEYEFPHKLIDCKNELTEEYLEKKLDLEKLILGSMSEGRQEEPAKLRRQSYRVEYIEYILGRLRNEN